MDIVHVVADYERVVTNSIRCNVATVKLLNSALWAFKNGGSPEVIEEYIERSIDALVDALGVMHARP